MDIPSAKVVHFAAEAWALDADALRDIFAPKRRTLLICLLHRAQVTTRDGLAEMFVKRMARLHAQGKEALTAMRARQQATTERLVTMLADVVEAAEDVAQESDAPLANACRVVLARRGGTEALRDDCLSVTAYNGNNYLPLLWPLFRTHRGTDVSPGALSRPVPDDPGPTMAQVLEFLLAHEQCRSEYLADVVHLDFASEQWQRAVFARRDGEVVMRRGPSSSASFRTLRSSSGTGDLFVPGSDAYADHRTQLLPWEECAHALPSTARRSVFPRPLPALLLA